MTLPLPTGIGSRAFGGELTGSGYLFCYRSSYPPERNLGAMGEENREVPAMSLRVLRECLQLAV